MIDRPDVSSPLRGELAVAGGLLAILLAAFLLFRPALNGPFVFDDFPNLQNLTQLEGQLDASHIGQYLAAFRGNPGRPLAALSFVIEDADWPTAPYPYKYDNLLFHLLAGVLLFALARRLARLIHASPGTADGIALATMAVWLLHPMQLSSTMLIVQRMNILGTIAMLAGLLGYLQALRQTRWSDYRRVVLAGGVLSIAGGLAMLCKENGVLIFAYASVLNVTLLRANVATLAPGPRRLLVWGAFLPILALIVAGVAELHMIAAGYQSRDFTLGERLLTESRILIDYLRQIFFPRIGDQGIFHDGYIVSRGLYSPPATAVAIAAIAALLGTAWRWRVRWPLYAFAVLWFFAGHLIESTIWPLELYFEHRNYLPMLGPLFAVVAAVGSVSRPYRGVAFTVLALWFAMAAGLTTVNARTWGDRGTLAAVWLHDNPRSPRAVQMMASYQADSGDMDAARKTLADGFARIPEAGELGFQSMYADCVSHGLSRDGWNAMVALGSRIGYSNIVLDLVSRLGQQARNGHCHGTMEEGDFVRVSEAILHNPAYASRNDSLAYVYYELGKQARFDGNLDKMMQYLDASYRYHPNPLVARNQAIDLLTAGLPDDAMRYLRISERNTEPWFKRRMLDMPRMNARLWLSARKMKADLKQPPTTASPSE